MYICKNNLPNISGEWRTNFNDMYLHQFGDRIIGRYEHANGVLVGTLEGNILSGTWYQSSSAGECNYGPFSLEFNRSMFKGTYGYCENLPGGNWIGQRKI